MNEQIADIREELRDLAGVIETAEGARQQLPESFGLELTLEGLLARRDQLNQELTEELKTTEERTEAIRGRLTGLFQHRMTFEFLETASGKYRMGHVIEDALQSAVRHYDREVDATFLIETTSVEEQQVRDDWTLVALEAASE